MRGSEGLIRMAYTWKSKQIKMVSFNETWIAAQEARSSNP
jgi:predicted neuraminidase